jgi:uncharacterized protein (TIGR03084 family)
MIPRWRQGSRAAAVGARLRYKLGRRVKPADSGVPVEQIADLREEAHELYRLLERLADGDWDKVTLFKGWTINDVVQHLHMGDVMATLSATDPAGFAALRADIQVKRDAGLSRVKETRLRLGDPRGRALLGRWFETLARLCELLAARDPADRLPWAGPDMSVRMFTTARQMETWAHGQEIWDVLGEERAPTDRLKNIAVIGVRTFGWTFANRGLPVPPDQPHVRLTAPSGATWEWSPPSPDNAVEGDALDFCQVVTQVRNVADTRLAVTGDTARRWLSIAQCFAGPPEDPPAPGTRYRQQTGHAPARVVS